jgi:hypothetical protein
MSRLKLISAAIVVDAAAITARQVRVGAMRSQGGERRFAWFVLNMFILVGRPGCPIMRPGFDNREYGRIP